MPRSKLLKIRALAGACGCYASGWRRIVTAAGLPGALHVIGTTHSARLGWSATGPMFPRERALPRLC